MNLLIGFMTIIVVALPIGQFEQQCSNVSLGCVNTSESNTEKCHVYIRKSLTRIVRSRTILHEVRHCNGWHH